MRTNNYLVRRLNFLWKEHFSDVEKTNEVTIHFGRKAKKRMGTIRRGIYTKDTVITINGHFRDKKIPHFVIDSTIVHELCHYAHGFSSPLPQLSPFPHKGGLVEKEFKKRGLESLLDKEISWLNRNWYKYLQDLGFRI